MFIDNLDAWDNAVETSKLIFIEQIPGLDLILL